MKEEKIDKKKKIVWDKVISILEKEGFSLASQAFLTPEGTVTSQVILISTKK